MARFQTYQAAFTAGQLDKGLLARKDINAFHLGCRVFRNQLPTVQGRTTVRPGLQSVAAGITGNAVAMAAFVFSENERYVVVFTVGRILVFNAASGIQESSTTLTTLLEQDIPNLRWQQLADSLVFVDGRNPIQQLVRGPTSWTLATWAFAGESQQYQPMRRFVAPEITLKPSGTTGTVTLTASAAIFQPGMNGRVYRIKQRAVRLLGYVSPTKHDAVVISEPDESASLVDTKTTTDWVERAFSSIKGWPTAVCLHQGRLWFAKDNQLWASWSNDLNKFWDDQGLDDQSINIQVTNGTFDPIRHLVSGQRSLEILTSGGEFVIPSPEGQPITPTTVEVRPQSGRGTGNARPAQLDGNTVFVQRDGGSLRLMVYDYQRESATTDSLVDRVPELVQSPRSLAATSDAFGLKLDVLLAVTGDGRIAALSWNRAQEVAAWSEWTTDGTFVAVVAVGSDMLTMVRRTGETTMRLEKFAVSARFDAEVMVSSLTPQSSFLGLGALAGRLVQLWADGRWMGETLVSTGGAVTLLVPASVLIAGLQIEWVLQPMPLELSDGTVAGRPRRISMATVRVVDTLGLQINGQRMPSEISALLLDQPQPLVSGEYNVRLLGFSRDPIVTLTREGPYPVNLQALVITAAVA